MQIVIGRKRNKKKELEGCSFLLVCLFQDFLMAAGVHPWGNFNAVECIDV